MTADDYFDYDYGLGGFSASVARSTHTSLVFIGAPHVLLRTGGVVAMSTKAGRLMVQETMENPLFKNIGTRNEALGNLWSYSLAVGDLEGGVEGMVRIW